MNKNQKSPAPWCGIAINFSVCLVLLLLHKGSVTVAIAELWIAVTPELRIVVTPELRITVRNVEDLVDMLSSVACCQK